MARARPGVLLRGAALLLLALACHAAEEGVVGTGVDGRPIWSSFSAYVAAYQNQTAALNASACHPAEELGVSWARRGRARRLRVAIGPRAGLALGGRGRQPRRQSPVLFSHKQIDFDPEHPPKGAIPPGLCEGAVFNFTR